MEYIRLSNGMQMPMIGLGTWDVRGENGKESILRAIDSGYRLIDTAQMYENEEIVGQAVRQSGLARKDIFITTKIYRPCTTYKKAKEAIERSLMELQMDYVDLLLIHEPYDTSLEMYEAMKEYYQQGKIKALGVSNFNCRKYNAFVKECGMIPVMNQVESHVYYPQLELKEQLEQKGTRMQSWASFTEGRRDIFREPLLLELAEKYGKTSAQIALKFLVQNGIAVIPKSVHRERMIQNMDIFDFMITNEDMNRIKCLDEGKTLFGWYD